MGFDMRKAIISLLLACSLTASFADTLELKDTHPNKYVVKKGDTLWDISGKFLKKPWRWPEIWQLNKSEIRNPHWIYPGDVIYLDYVNGKPRLRIGRGASMSNGVRKLSPMVRVVDLNDKDAIFTIPASAIEPFLSQPIVISDEQLKASPRVAVGENQPSLFGKGDKLYGLGLAQANTGSVWQVYRQGKALIDPADPEKKRVLGYEAVYKGDVQLQKAGDVSTLLVVKTTMEIEVGDRMIAAPIPELHTYAPHAPIDSLKGQIVSGYGGIAEMGRYSMVLINLGSKQGIENGHVLSIWKAGKVIVKEDKSEITRLTPQEEIGHALVFRTFDNMAYALVMEGTEAINAGDYVKTPQ